MIGHDSHSDAIYTAKCLWVRVVLGCRVLGFSIRKNDANRFEGVAKSRGVRFEAGAKSRGGGFEGEAKVEKSRGILKSDGVNVSKNAIKSVVNASNNASKSVVNASKDACFEGPHKVATSL